MSGYCLESLKFLVIDDNKHMRALVKTILYSLGCKNVLEAGDGADALKELEHSTPDIVICDWHMSPLDGLDFVRLVRTGADSSNPFIPILMLTGHTESRRVMEARDAGVSEFLAKPISAASLYRRIKAIIENPRPFIKYKGYFGPDRRRRQIPGYPNDRRVAEAVETIGFQSGADRRELTADEVSELMNGDVGR